MASSTARDIRHGSAPDKTALTRSVLRGSSHKKRHDPPGDSSSFWRKERRPCTIATARPSGAILSKGKWRGTIFEALARALEMPVR